MLASSAKFVENLIQFMTDLKETGWRNTSLLTKRILTVHPKNLVMNNSMSIKQVVIAVICSLVGHCISQEVKLYISLARLSSIGQRNLIWERELASRVFERKDWPTKTQVQGFFWDWQLQEGDKEAKKLRWRTFMQRRRSNKDMRYWKMWPASLVFSTPFAMTLWLLVWPLAW